jgi:hypothetical protein
MGSSNASRGNKDWVQKAVGNEICCRTRSRTPFRPKFKLRTGTYTLQPEVEVLNTSTPTTAVYAVVVNCERLRIYLAVTLSSA